jgi:hypothetical protein
MADISQSLQEPSVAPTPGFNPGVPLRRQLIPLCAVFGQDEASHGTERYRVDNDGLVRVPVEAVAFLTSKGGFVVAKTTTGPILVSGDAEPSTSTRELKPASEAKPARETGMVKLHHDEDIGCSYDGREYPSDENGEVLVPAEAALELLGHGFAPVSQGALAPKRLTPAPSGRSRKG